MNCTEERMVEILKILKKDFGVIAVKSTTVITKS